MITNLYSIYDIKSETYAPPFCSVTDGVAIREVAQKVVPNAKDFLDDYRLFRIGTIDVKTSQLCSLDNPKHIIDLSSLSE